MTVYVSNASGTWTTTTIWTPNGDPGAGDEVNIAAGHTVHLAASRTVALVRLKRAGAGYGATPGGILEIDDGFTLTCTTDFNVETADLYPTYKDGSNYHPVGVLILGAGSKLVTTNYDPEIGHWYYTVAWLQSKGTAGNPAVIELSAPSAYEVPWFVNPYGEWVENFVLHFTGGTVQFMYGQRPSAKRYRHCYFDFSDATTRYEDMFVLRDIGSVIFEGCRFALNPSTPKAAFTTSTTSYGGCTIFRNCQFGWDINGNHSTTEEVGYALDVTLTNYTPSSDPLMVQLTNCDVSNVTTSLIKRMVLTNSTTPKSSHLFVLESIFTDQTEGAWRCDWPQAEAYKTTAAAKTGTYGIRFNMLGLKVTRGTSLDETVNHFVEPAHFDFALPIQGGQLISPKVYIRCETGMTVPTTDDVEVIFDLANRWGLEERVNATGMTIDGSTWNTISGTGGTASGTSSDKGFLVIRVNIRSADVGYDIDLADAEV